MTIRFPIVVFATSFLFLLLERSLVEVPFMGHFTNGILGLVVATLVEMTGDKHEQQGI